MRWPGKYMKPATRVSVPSSVFAVVVEPREGHHAANERASYRVWSAAHVWHVRRDRGGWARPREASFNDSDALRGYLMGHASDQRKNWVVSPDAVETLTLSGWWGYAERKGVRWGGSQGRAHSPLTAPPDNERITIRRICVNGRVGILDYSADGLRWVWVSARNYWSADEREVKESLLIPWLDTESLSADGAGVTRTPRERAYVWLVAFTRLADWWAGQSKAPFGLTAGQLGTGLIRTHVPPKTLCTHTNSEVHRLERVSAFGGRASVWYYGRVRSAGGAGGSLLGAPPAPSYPPEPGPAVRIDVRSMYPHLLRDRTFPTRLCGHYFNPPLRDLKAWLGLGGVIAAVQMSTSVAEYPVHGDDRVVYPTGTFTTILTGPELELALRDSRIVKVHEMACYRMGRPFAGAADTLIRLREECRGRGDSAGEMFAKLAAVAMGGKLAQRRGRWAERRKKNPQTLWGEWCEERGNGEGVRRFRSVAGLVWEWTQEESPAGPYTAAFSYLTAYGRVWMRELRRLAGQREVYQQDTDGLWCTPRAADTLRAAGVGFGNTSGTLRVDKVASSLQFLSPRHYWSDSGWVLAGFTRPTVSPDGRRVTDTYVRSPVRSGERRAPDAVWSVSRDSELTPDPGPGQIAPDGWFHPPHVG